MGGLSEAVEATIGSSLLMGDVNHDGEISLVDITMTVEYNLTQNAEGFFFENADMNGDGEISIVDIMSIVDIILSQSTGN